MERRQRRTLVSAMSVQIAAGLPVFLVGALASHLRDDLSLSAGSIGVAVSAFYGTSALAAYPLGRVADSLGWRRSLWGSSAGIAASLAGISLLLRTQAGLVGLLVLAGATHSLASSTANVALANGTPAGHHGKLFGIKQAATPVATLLAGLSVPLVVEQVGWRPAFLMAVLVPAFAAFAARSPDSPGSVVGAGPVDGDDVGSAAENTAGRVHSSQSDDAPDGGRGIDLRLFVLMLSGAFGSWGTSSLSAFFVVSAVDHGVSASRAGAVMAVASALSIVIRVVGGWIADRRSGTGFGQAAVLLLVGMVGYGLLAAGRPSMILMAAMFAYGAGWGWPGLYHFGGVRYRPETPGAVTGIIRTGSASGATLGPVVFGLVLTWGGYSWAWGTVATGAGLSAIMMYLASRPMAGARDAAVKRTDTG